LNSRAAEEAGIDGEFKLENFTYTTPTVLEVLDGHLRNTNFSGITVRCWWVVVKSGTKMNEAVGFLHLCCLPSVTQMMSSSVKDMVRANLVFPLGHHLVHIVCTSPNNAY